MIRNAVEAQRALVLQAVMRANRSLSIAAEVHQAVANKGNAMIIDVLVGGSAPMCYPRAEFRIGQRDVLLGSIADSPFYISGSQYEYWQGTHLTIDVVKGRGSGFSVEAPEGVRFLVSLRVFTDEEWAEL